jgi:hypothetical protein
MTKFRTTTSIIMRKPRVYMAAEGECLLARSVEWIMTTRTYV